LNNELTKRFPLVIFIVNEECEFIRTNANRFVGICQFINDVYVFFVRFVKRNPKEVSSVRRLFIILLCLCLLPLPAGAAEGPKYVALTFDDGPSGRFTRTLLKGLRDRDVRATFFLCGYRMEEYPELAKTVTVMLPDEKTRRVGQSVAAASLPELR
jgi:hypothetical protein